MALPTADAKLPPQDHHKVVMWLLLIVAAGVLLMRAGGPFPPPWPVGFDHAEYLTAAWSVVHGHNAGYPLFRPPLYPALLGTLAEWVGYGQAGAYLSLLGMALVMASALWISLLFAGPLAAGLATVWVAVAPFSAEVLFWTSPYPLLAGLVGTCLAGLATWQSKGGSLAPLVAGLSLAMGAAIDGRLWLLLPFLLGTAGWVAATTSRYLPLLGALLPLLLVPWVDQHLSIVERPPLTDLLQQQQSRALEEVRGRPDAHFAPCRSQVPPPSLSSLTHPCTPLLIQEGVENTRQVFPFGLGAYLPGLLLVCWGLGWRRGGILGGISLVGGLGVMLSTLWVPAPARYLLPWLVPLVVVWPVAVVALLRRVLPDYPHVQTAVTAGVAAAFLYGQWEPAPTPARDNPAYTLAGELTTYLRRQLRPGDLLLDCSGRSLEVYLLPHHYHGPPTNLQGSDVQRCQAWLDLRDPLPRRVITGGEGTISSLRVGPGWVLEQEARWEGHTLKVWKTPTIP